MDWRNKDIGNLQIGDGQAEMDTFREICHGHQQELSPWSKREREREIACCISTYVYAMYAVCTQPFCLLCLLMNCILSKVIELYVVEVEHKGLQFTQTQVSL